MVGLLLSGEIFGAPVEKVMLVGFSAGGLSSLLAADTLGVVGFVGLDPFGRAMPGETERLGLAAAGRLQVEAMLLRAPPSRCNAEAVAAPWSTVLPALWRDELIADASHCDFESPTDWMCRLARGDTDPRRSAPFNDGCPNRRLAGHHPELSFVLHGLPPEKGPSAWRRSREMLQVRHRTCGSGA